MKKQRNRKNNLLLLITLLVALIFSQGFTAFASETDDQRLTVSGHKLMSAPPYTAEEIERDHAPMLSLYAVLPSALDNTSKFPKPGNQGSQESCVAWAIAYAYKTMQDNLDHGWGLNSTSTQFSPAFVYNSINGGRDAGSNIGEAMRLLRDKGCCTLADMPYSSRDYTTKPNSTQLTKAYPHRSKSYSSVYGVTELKNSIYNTGGAVIGIPIYADFENLSILNQIYDKTTGVLYGYHAICLIGYDDDKQAFKFINSWGTGWGLAGYGYIAYSLITNTRLGISGYTMTDYIENATKNDYSPKGSFESVTVSGTNNISLTGWAFDDDLPTAAINIQVYIGGTASSSSAEFKDLGPANVSRSDIGAANPGRGNNHGFNKTITTSKTGTQTVYVYATNIDSSGKASGSAVLLGSKSVTLSANASANNNLPKGNLSTLTAGTFSFSLTGWAFDDDAPTNAVNIQVYVGGPKGTVGAEFHDIGPANVYQLGVGLLYPGRGYYHGYNETVTTKKSGSQTIYVYAVNIDSSGKANGSDVLLGSKTVTIKGAANNSSPKGALDTMTINGNSISLTGWAFDDDVPTSAVNIHLYVGGTASSSTAEFHDLGPANINRADIAANYPGRGNNHGFNKTITTKKTGILIAYVYAVNIDSAGIVGGNNVLLGSKIIIVR